MLHTRNHPRTRRPHVRLHLDELEDRTLLTAFTPAQIATAYGFNQINFGTTSSPVPGDGRGQTIALVDAYADPHIAADVATFSTTYGLPQFNTGGPTLTVNDLSNGKADPTRGTWEAETALDVEWAHAVAPQANILLVEAADDLQDPNTGSLTALLSAVNTAAATPGVVAVSMSWGVQEYANEVLDEGVFSAAAHPGVTFVAASGDAGAGVAFPAISSNVLSVGGTSLTLDTTGAYQGETGWGNGIWSWLYGGSGGGRSRYEPQPSYQSGVVPDSMSTPSGGDAMRTNPDVAYNADPGSGVSVYNNGAYYTVGGTSVGAPQWAALVAIADQGAALQGSAPLTGATQTLPALYAAAQGDFHDVTSGNNGFAAGPGYDLVTGRGAPKAQLIVNDLVQAAGSSSTTLTAGASSSSGGGSSSTTFSSSQMGQSNKTLPTPSPTPARPHDVVGPTTPQTTGVMPVTITPAAGTTSTTTPVVILSAPVTLAYVTSLPTAAAVTAVPLAAPPAFTTTVTGLTPLPTFSTANSGGGESDEALGPTVNQPIIPADFSPDTPAQEDSTPMPAVPGPEGAALPGAALGVFDGGLLAGDTADDGTAAFTWDDGECPTVPNSGAAVAALLLALGYSGAGRARRPEEDERLRDRLAS